MGVKAGARSRGVRAFLRGWVVATAGAAVLLMALGANAPSALAQQSVPPAAVGVRIAFNIPSQDLNAALLSFADTAGVQLFYDVSRVENLRSTAVRGDLTRQEALARLLDGTGIAFRFTDSSTVTLQPMTAEQGSGPQQLGPITVEARSESAIGPVDGYVANRSLTGTKTNTPLIETPQSISIITRDQLDDRDADTINEALRYTPGFQGEVFGNDSRVDFLRYRGFDEAGTGVFLDGLQLRSSAFAEFRPELYGAQRVEVLRGPASVLYGQSGAGGLVNLVTKRPTFEPFGEVELEAGSFDHFEGKADIGGPLAGLETLAFRLTGLFRDSDTQVDFVDDNRKFIAPALTFRPREDTTLTILGRYQDDRTGSTNQFLPAEGTLDSNPNGTIPDRRFIGEPGFDGFDRTAYGIGYLLEHEVSTIWTFRQNARYDALEVDSKSVFGGGLQADQRTLNRFAFVANGDTDQFTVDTQAQADFVTGGAAHTLLLGVDYQRYEVDDFQRFGAAPSLDIFSPVYGAAFARPPVSTDANTVQDQVGLYAQEQLKIFEDLVVTVGGRHDFVFSEREDRLADTKSDQDDSEFSWRAGLVYLFDVGLAPYANYSRSFLPIVGTDGNGDAFEPETGTQYEVGVKYQPPGFNSSVTLAAFHITRENVRTPDPNNPLNQVQTGEVRSQGIEVEGTASFDFGLDLTAAYTFQDVEITESNAGDEGNRPTLIPEHLASLWADYGVQTGPLAGLGIGGGVRYKGSTFGDAANSFKVDDFILVDAAIRYDWRDFTFALRADNLLDNRHVAGCSSGNACFYGTEQTIVASVRYRW